MVLKFSEDYSQILSVLKIGLIQGAEYCFYTQYNILAI
jgi:hypothetical protein